MKPIVLAKRLAPLLLKLQCPRCQSPFSLTAQSLVCENGHCFDLSKRGYVNLAPAHNQAAEKYDAQLFASRHLVLDRGFYAPIAQAVCDLLPLQKPFLLVDAGCGEGYYARRIADGFPSAQVLGVDISRDAITAATRLPSRAHFLVADLLHLPMADRSADVVLDVLTPANYNEFRRVLAPEGTLLKVIPGADYLREIRAAVAPHLRGGQTYDNARVLAHLSDNADILHQKEIRLSMPLDEEAARAFLRMTPMTFSIPQDVLDGISISHITLHMHVLQCAIH